MKKISLAPYYSHVLLVRTVPELKRAHKRLTKKAIEVADNVYGMTYTFSRRGQANSYLVYAKSTSDLAHEFTHVLLNLFKEIGCDPTEGNGEPMAYMMSYLMDEARK